MKRKIKFKNEVDVRYITQFLISTLNRNESGLDDPQVYSSRKNPGLEVFNGLDCRNKKFGVYFKGKPIFDEADVLTSTEFKEYTIVDYQVSIPERTIKFLKSAMNGNPVRKLTAEFLL